MTRRACLLAAVGLLLLPAVAPAEDTTPPETTLVRAPATATADRTPFIAWLASEPGASFECSLDYGPWTVCGSFATPGPLGFGWHGFAVRARDAAGNVDPTPAGKFFYVMRPVPELTVITGRLASNLVAVRRRLRAAGIRRLTLKRGLVFPDVLAFGAGTLELRVTTLDRAITLLAGRTAAGPLRARPTRVGRRLLRQARRMEALVGLRFTELSGRRTSVRLATTLKRY